MADAQPPAALTRSASRSRCRHGRPAGLSQLALRQALASLSAADRTLTLLWLEGLTAAEIESVTGVKAATVAVRLSRIRKALATREVKHA